MELIVIVGPTAVGKSEYAIKLAHEVNGEIINADSVQIYQKLSIGSNKISPSQQQGIPHHLLDIIDPSSNYTVFNFQKDARAAIADIKNRGKTPILCGGTGLYINATLYDYQFPSENSDQTAAYSQLTNHQLYDKLPPQVQTKIGLHNRPRLIRANIRQSLGYEVNLIPNRLPKYKAKIIFLNANRQQLYDRINKRVDQMIQNGLVDEVSHFNPEWQSQRAIGYKEVHQYLSGTISHDAMVAKIKQNTRRLAKKQISWFKNQITCHEEIICEDKER